MLANVTQISPPPAFKNTNKITGFLRRQGGRKKRLLKYCKKGCQETKSTCYQYTADFQVKQRAILAPPLLENGVNVALIELK